MRVEVLRSGFPLYLAGVSVGDTPSDPLTCGYVISGVCLPCISAGQSRSNCVRGGSCTLSTRIDLGE